MATPLGRISLLVVFRLPVYARTAIDYLSVLPQPES